MVRVASAAIRLATRRVFSSYSMEVNGGGRCWVWMTSNSSSSVDSIKTAIGDVQGTSMFRPDVSGDFVLVANSEEDRRASMECAEQWPAIWEMSAASALTLGGHGFSGHTASNAKGQESGKGPDWQPRMTRTRAIFPCWDDGILVPAKTTPGPV